MENAEIVFRHALPGDAKKIVEYLKVVGNETDNLSFSGDSIVLNEIQEASFIAGLEEINNACMILALVGDQVIAIGSLEGQRQARFAHRASLGVSVRKSFWHLGIGTMMVDELIEYAYNHQLEVLDLEVITTNKRAISLYESFGFVTIGEYGNYSKVANKHLDAYIMTLDLTDNSL